MDAHSPCAPFVAVGDWLHLARDPRDGLLVALIIYRVEVALGQVLVVHDTMGARPERKPRAVLWYHVEVCRIIQLLRAVVAVRPE